MVDYVLKYRTSNLIIIYYCVYSGLLGTIKEYCLKLHVISEECRVWFLDWYAIGIEFDSCQNSRKYINDR